MILLFEIVVTLRNAFASRQREIFPRWLQQIRIYILITRKCGGFWVQWFLTIRAADTSVGVGIALTAKGRGKSSAMSGALVTCPDDTYDVAVRGQRQVD